MRVLSLFLLLLSWPVLAQQPLQLTHTLVEMEASAGATRLVYRLDLANTGSQGFQGVRLVLHDVSLSLTSPAETIEFHTLSATQQKHRFLTLYSALSVSQLTASEDLLFQLQAQDEQGQIYSILLRSKGLSP